MTSASEDPLPWGALPIEQYLIQNWSSSSPLPSTAQHRHLVRAFLNEDTIPTATTLTPPATPDQITTILAPFRPPHLRTIAARIWANTADEVPWLRTSYAAPTGAQKLLAYLDLDEDHDPTFDPDATAWRVLDDAAVFACADGDDASWRRILDVVPELAGPVSGFWRVRVVEGPLAHPSSDKRVRGLRARLREEVRGAVGDKAGVVEAGPSGVELQAAAVTAWVVVLDAEAFATDRLRVLFLDAKGRVVRWGRGTVEELTEVKFFPGMGRLAELKWLTVEGACRGLEEGGSVLGEMYKARGEVGRELYGVEDLL